MSCLLILLNSLILYLFLEFYWIFHRNNHVIIKSLLPFQSSCPFPCLITMTSVSSTVLNEAMRADHCLLLLLLLVQTFSHSPLSTLPVAFYTDAHYRLKNLFSFPSFLGVFISNGCYIFVK